MKYTPVKSLSVLLSRGDGLLPVGKLALKDRQVWFQYDASFRSKGLQLSPLHLPLMPEVVAGDPGIFDGLFGLFNDSLPDGWGRLLLDRHMTRLGIAHENLTVLDRLAYVGQRGMGSLVYEPDHAADKRPLEEIDLDQLARESRRVPEGESKDVIEKLLSLNASSQGARPKVMVGVKKDKKHIIHCIDDIPQDYEHWLIKFTSGTDPEDNGAIEYAYSLMAREAGIQMPDTCLFPSKKGAGHFGVKRFDRNNNKRTHVHTVSGLLHADHRMPSLDYEGILKATQMLTKSMTEVEAMFRLAVFNVLAHNRDDHSKNFSFLMDADGTWHASPAYDIVFSAGPGGEHSTMVMGEGRSPHRQHLKELGKKLDIKKADTIIDQVSAATAQWNEFAETSGVTKESRNHIAQKIGSLSGGG